MKKIKFFSLVNLGEGRIKITLIVNFWLVALLVLLCLTMALLGSVVYWLGVGIVALAKLLWGIKWWLLALAFVVLLVWLLTKVNWRDINFPKRVSKKRSRGWLWALLAVLALLLGIFLFRGCDREEADVTEPVTEARFKEPGAWIMLDAYLSEGFNVRYADYKKFKSYGEILSYEERLKAFDREAYYADWGRLFPYFEGKSFNDNQLAALQRYGLWCGLAGFEASLICKKLQNGEEVSASDFAKVYMADGKERAYAKSSREYVKKYAWVLMNLYDGNITITELLDCPVKSFENIPVKDMYGADGNYIFNQGLKAQLQKPNGNKKTREVLKL